MLIYRARCRDCGLEQRRKSEPLRRNDAHNDLFCHDCVHPLEWQRWEVVEERGWRVGVVGTAWTSRLLTKEEADRVAREHRRLDDREVIVRRIVRRALRRVRG